MSTKVVRVKIIKPSPNSINQLSWKQLGDILSSASYETCLAQNEAVRLFYLWQHYQFNFNDKVGAYPTKEDVSSILEGYSSINGKTYSLIKDKYNNLTSNSLAYAINEAEAKFKQHKKEMLKGKESLITFKNNGNIYIKKDQIKVCIDDNGGDYILKLSLLPKDVYKDYGFKNGIVDVVVGAKEGFKKGILKNIISGECQVCGSMIIKDKKGNWCVNITFKKVSAGSDVTRLDENKILGVDLGIAKAVYCAINTDDYWSQYIDGGEITAFMIKKQKLRRQMFKNASIFTDSVSGKGRKRKVENADRIGTDIAEFRNYINHKYSKAIVEWAYKNNCGTIQMEDLSGIGELSTFLKNWSYYDLQSKIIYKASTLGIKVVKINPKYTSQRCNKCGYIDKENRQTQEKFVCLKCGHEDNADRNAAKNIAVKDIDRLIANYK